MNWYAMMLDGRMRSDEMIRKAQEMRRASAATTRQRLPGSPNADQAAGGPASPAGLLQILWHRLIGAEIR